MQTNKIYKALYLKVLLVLSIPMLISSSYATNPEQLDRVTFDLKKVALKSVFSNIEQQTNFRFFYENDIVDTNRKVSINVENTSVDKVLSQVLKGTNTIFKIIGKQIVITKKIDGTGAVEPSTVQSVKVQVQSIKGTVTSSDGVPLPAVAVIVRGTQRGTQTDFDGNYVIEANSGEVLEFSSLGFKTQEIIVASQTVINVQLEEDVSALNEVVLIGYGSA